MIGGAKSKSVPLLAGLTLITLLVYAIQAFLLHPWAIADDARQFLSWTSRLYDPASRPGDVLADYWQQTAPPLYGALLHIAAALGVAPVLFAKLLAFPLVAITAVLAWKLSACFTVDARCRLMGSLFVMAAIIHNDSIFSGTPRAFASPLILLTLIGLPTRRYGLTIAGLLLLSIVYPAPAITCLGIFSLWILAWRFPIGFSLSWRSVALLALAAILVLGSALLFKAGMGDWGPVLRLGEARSMPSLMSVGGRSSIVGRGGDIAWLCSPRIGYLPAIINCQGNGDPRLLVNLLLSVVPMLALWVRVRRGQGAGEDSLADSNRAYALFPYALLATAICYLIAALVAFTFHLPARYSQPVLLIMGSLASGLWAGRAWNWLLERKILVKPFARMAIMLFATAAAVGIFATPKTRVVHAEHPDLLAFIVRTPPGTRIAGISDDLSFIPALTGRSVLTTPEHDIPYHKRYHRESQAGLEASLKMGRFDDLQSVRDHIKRYRVDLLVFDRQFLVRGELPESYKAVLPSTTEVSPMFAEAEALGRARCHIIEGPGWIALFASCLS